MSIKDKLPSGMEVTVRALTGKEIDTYAAADQANTADPFGTRMLSDCCKVTSPGPYNLDVDGGIDWSGVLTGDRAKATLLLLVATMGPIVSHKFKCRNLTCGKSFYSDHNLLHLPRLDYTAETLKHYATGEPFVSTSLVKLQGPEVRFDLSDNKLTQRLVKIQGTQSGEGPMALLAARVHSIKTSQGESTSKGVITEAFRALDPFCLAILKQDMQAVEAGIDTTISIACPHCNDYSEEVDLPLDLPSILSPGMRVLGLNTPFKMALLQSPGLCPYQLQKTLDESASS